MKSDKEEFKTAFKKRLYNWTLRLIRFIDSLPKDTSSLIISKQVLRSGTSIGANYIEAQAASSKRDFTNFLHHSLKSANESKFWLMVLIDTNRGNSEEVKIILKELIEISNILGASILTLKARR